MDNSDEDVDSARIPAGGTGTYVRISDCHRPDRDALLLLTIDAEAPGLSANIGIETLGGDGLVAFLQTLDDDFRGWTGDRLWSSFRHDLEIRARHWGHTVQLAWTLRFLGSDYGGEQWKATVHLWINPGEELRRVVADVRDLINAASE